jgi:hypothetical protein
MPDFSQPGDDGTLPDGFAVWRRGVTYTVRPEMLSPLLCGQEYRINATVRRKIPKDEEFRAYGDLYQRCVGILRARSAKLRSSDEGEPLHTWVQWHAWWCGTVSDKYPGAGDHKVACSSVTNGLAYPKKGDPKHPGQNPPEPTQLVKPGGAMAELLSSQNVPAPRFDEAYMDFDFNDLSSASTDTTLSYGEYINSTRRINFKPFVQRAQSLANVSRCLKIVRREWFCIAESKLVVVMVYFRT